jgi:hypothetical protein
MNHPVDRRPAEHLEALQGRLALRLTAALGEQAQALPHDIGERLRIGRERALERARAVRVEAAPAVVGVSRHGAALLGGGPSWWMRLASFAPLLVLVAGLVLIQHWNSLAQIDAAAEIDAALLSDDLPPAAYTDPGFGEFLKQPQP